MAAGTVVSRLSGFVRGMLLAAALGSGLRADQFTIANTIPNMLYILLAGGVFNAVLVPQLVRAMRHDPDGGEAYTNRVVTLAALFLGAVSVLLVVAAPWVMSVFLSAEWDAPRLAEQRDSLVALARYCLPQVFFYGMFVLVGQILNARGRFGPMMWAPIANNVISVAVLVAYLLVWGPTPADQLTGAHAPGQEALLGLGSTLGIAVQLLILLPYLRAAGFRYRPRFDFRDAGLGHTLRLGLWTVLFVVVNQVAYTVVVRLASSGTAAVAGTDSDATGYTIYSTAFLVVMVPHSVVTVSLATAVLPRLSARAADGDLRGIATSLSGVTRTALAVVVPFVALLPVVASDMARVMFGHGANEQDWPLYVPTLSLFGLGIGFFTLHYLVLRGFYALEQTRTVFWIQCVVAGTNIAAALLLVSGASPVQTSPRLVVAYACAYAVGSALSLYVLRRRLGGLDGHRLVRFLVRLGLATVPGTAAAYALSRLLHHLVPDGGWPFSLLVGAASALVAAVLFLLCARLFRLREVTDVLDLVVQRVRPRTRG
jgi:putative peptidoglycan lipid II flippase